MNPTAQPKARAMLTFGTPPVNQYTLSVTPIFILFSVYGTLNYHQIPYLHFGFPLACCSEEIRNVA